MILQNDIAEVLQRAFRRGKLRENIAAVSVFAEHFLDSAELTDDAVNSVFKYFLRFLASRRMLMPAAAFCISILRFYDFIIQNITPYTLMGYLLR